MVVKGLIKTIDYNGNTCTVRIPVFEGTAGEKETIVQAVIATSPGIYNGYKEDDVVFIAFENNEINMPIVIGKLYLGASKESKDPRGAINAEHLQSATPISIPIDTKLTLNNDPTNLSIARVDGDLSCYKTIADLAKNLKKQETQIGSINIRMIDDGESWGAEIQKLTDENDLRKAEIRANADAIENSVVHINSKNIQEGLGWHLDVDNWRLFAKDTVGDTVQELDLLRADRTGLTLYGNTRLIGYPTDVETTYALVEDWATKEDIINGVATPTWSTEFPQHNDAQYIWQRVATTKYEYDAESETHWKTTTSYEYYCLSTIDAVHISANYAQTAADNARNKAESSYALAQGKSTNYYDDDNPARPGSSYVIKEGDCWFDTSERTINIKDAIPKVKNADGTDNDTGYFGTKEEYIGYFIAQTTTETTTQRDWADDWYGVDLVASGILDLFVTNGIVNQSGDANFPSTAVISNGDIEADDFYIDVHIDGNEYKFRLESSTEDSETWRHAGGAPLDLVLSTPLTKVETTTTEVVTGYTEIDADHLNLVTPGETIAYIKDKNTLKQWVGANSDQTPPGHWEEIGGELVANKVTAQFINALDITAKKITVVNPSITPTESEPEKNILFRADAEANKVKIAGFEVTNTEISTDNNTSWTNNILSSGNINQDGSIFISPGFKYRLNNNNYSEPIAIKVGENFEVTANGEVLIKQLSIAPDSSDGFSLSVSGSSTTNISADGKLYCTNAELDDAIIDATKLSFDTVELTKAQIGSSQALRVLFNSKNDATFESTNDGMMLTHLKIQVNDSTTLEPYTNGISRTFKLTIQYYKATDYILDTRVYSTIATLNGWDNLGDGHYELHSAQIVIPKPLGVNEVYSIKSCSLAPTTFTVGTTASVLQINSSFIPATDGVYDLGDSNYKWNTLYATDIQTTKLKGDTLSTKTVDSVVYWTKSDQRLKTDINYNLDKFNDLIDNIKPATYKLKAENSNKIHFGFIAQDIQKILADNNLNALSIVSQQDELYSINYTELHALEIYEIQKLKKEIKELKEELAALKQK